MGLQVVTARVIHRPTTIFIRVPVCIDLKIKNIMFYEIRPPKYVVVFSSDSVYIIIIILCVVHVVYYTCTTRPCAPRVLPVY